MKRLIKKIVLISLFGLTSIFGEAQIPGLKLPFEMPVINVPVFRPDTFNIKNYGAVNDGITLNTKAIEATFEACAKAGGGTVLVPSGLWLTGPIKLRSNVNLHLEKGALLLFSRNLDDYPLVEAYYEGLSTMRCQSPISGTELENIAITGGGVINGSGDAWRPVKKDKLTSQQWNRLVKSGGIIGKDKETWYPSEKSRKGSEINSSGYLGPNAKAKDYEAIKDFLRPVMVDLLKCKNILLEGVTFQNSPSWCLHPLMCEHLTLRKVNVVNPWYAQNGDGIDIESCRIGQLDRCTFDAGDDAICIKSGRNEEGRKRNMPTELFVITNCVVYHGHGGFVIGSEMSGGARNLYVSNCTFLGTDVGLRFKTARGRGGVVEKIYVDGISMINIATDAIGFDMYYGGNSPVPDSEEAAGESPKEENSGKTADESTPQFRDFYIKNITCNGAARAIFLRGLPEMSIKNINLENISIKSTTGFTCIEGDKINLKNVKLDVAKGNGGTIVNGTNLDFDGFKCSGNTDKLFKISGKKSANIRLKNSGDLKDCEMAGDVDSKAVVKD
jgi:DNA sulfur modification protein DndE